MSRRVLAALGALAALASFTTVHSHTDADADPDDLTFRAATPILDVASVEKSMAYYIDRLGFSKNWDWPDDSDDKTFGSVINGDVAIFLSETDGPVHPVWIFYNVNSADTVHAAYVAAGVTILEAPEDKPWGSREFLAADLDGHVLRIAADLPHEH